MTYVYRELADKYQEFFNFMSQEHDLILIIEQMDEILYEAQKLNKKLSEFSEQKPLENDQNSH